MRLVLRLWTESTIIVAVAVLKRVSNGVMAASHCVLRVGHIRRRCPLHTYPVAT